MNTILLAREGRVLVDGAPVPSGDASDIIRALAQSQQPLTMKQIASQVSPGLSDRYLPSRARVLRARISEINRSWPKILKAEGHYVRVINIARDNVVVHYSD